MRRGALPSESPAALRVLPGRYLNRRQRSRRQPPGPPHSRRTLGESENQLLWPPLSPQAGGEDREGRIRIAWSATARFFGRRDRSERRDKGSSGRLARGL